MKKHAMATREGAVSLEASGSLRVDSGQLPSPADTYDADYAWVVDRNGAVSLFFAKGAPGSPSELTSRVEVRFPYEAFVMAFWKSSGTFFEEVKPRAERYAPLSGREHPNPQRLTPIKQHSLWANVVLMTRAGSVVCTDLFYLAPASLVKFGRTQDVASIKIDPLLRVITTIGEIVLMLEAGKELVERLRQYVDDEELEQ